MNPELISRLLSGEAVSRLETLNDDDLAALGLSFDNNRMWLADEVERLERARIVDGMNAKARALWPHFDVLAESASTNAALIGRGADAAGCALTAEYQSAGRGRRGRVWVSPVARNIALSLGVMRSGSLNRMAGLSLVAGLATVDALRSLGVQEVALKWPNDLIVLNSNGYSKLGGILVELQQASVAPDAGGALAVVGLGINLGGAPLVAQSVGQEVADVAFYQPQLGRNTVLIAVVNALADYIEHWRADGFDPMVEVYDTVHAFTGKPVTISRPAGVIHAQVLGVTGGGELRVRTEDGAVVEIDAGEVSLRQRGDSPVTS